MREQPENVKLIDPDDLVGAHEIAKRLGLALPQTVHSWRKRYENFPAPVVMLTMGLAWDWNEIQEWVNNRKTKKENNK